MDGIDLGGTGDVQDVVNVEVGLQGLPALAYQVALVGLEAVQRQPILARVDGHGTDTHLRGGAHYADGDFGAVGDQDGFDFSGKRYIGTVHNYPSFYERDFFWPRDAQAKPNRPKMGPGNNSQMESTSMYSNSAVVAAMDTTVIANPIEF